MKRTVSAVSLTFFLAVTLAAGGAVITATPTSLVASQGSSYCQENFPGDPQCHDDMNRDSCTLAGCHSAIHHCCIIDP